MWKKIEVSQLPGLSITGVTHDYDQTSSPVFHPATTSLHGYERMHRACGGLHSTKGMVPTCKFDRSYLWLCFGPFAELWFMQLAQFQPSELIVTNDSWRHRHHAAMKAEGGGNGETRMSTLSLCDAWYLAWTTMQISRYRSCPTRLRERCAVYFPSSYPSKVSNQIIFVDGPQSTMQRHRMIYSILSEELSQGLHALSIKTQTPEEVQDAQGTQSAWREIVLEL